MVRGVPVVCAQGWEGRAPPEPLCQECGLTQPWKLDHHGYRGSCAQSAWLLSPASGFASVSLIAYVLWLCVLPPPERRNVSWRATCRLGHRDHGGGGDVLCA